MSVPAILSSLIGYAARYGPDLVETVSGVVSNFMDDHPELRGPPQETRDKSVDAKVDRMIEEKFKSLPDRVRDDRKLQSRLSAALGEGDLQALRQVAADITELADVRAPRLPPDVPRFDSEPPDTEPGTTAYDEE